MMNAELYAPGATLVSPFWPVHCGEMVHEAPHIVDDDEDVDDDFEDDEDDFDFDAEEAEDYDEPEDED